MRVNFMGLASLGYSRLVPVIPPDAPLAPDASPELIASRGKVPGRRPLSASGAPLPHFLPIKGWLQYVLTENDARWFTETECNAGLILGPASGIYCLDLDITAPDVAAAACEALVRAIGHALPYRIGNWPKVAFFFRAPPGPGIRRVRVKLQDARGTDHLIELLGEGQQAVIAGMHPKTHGPYGWSYPSASGSAGGQLAPFPPALPELPALDITRLTDLPRMLAEELVSRAGCRVIAHEGRLSGGTTKSQAELLAPSMEALRAAVEALPNKHEQFPTRESYVQVGYAIKAAAGPEDEDEAFRLFLEWCERWDHGTNDFDTVAKDWRGIVGDKRIGWQWLIQRARECGVELQGLSFDAAPLPPAPEGTLGPSPDDATIHYSQDDCAQRIMMEHQWAFMCRPANARHVEWFRWNGRTWELDQGQMQLKHTVRMMARRIASELITAEPSATNMKSARGITSLTFANGVLGLLPSYLEFNGITVQFDANPWLLNTPAGLVNLTNGKIGPHDPKQFCASITRVSPKLNPTPDEWSYTRAWMHQITCGDVLLERFLYQLAALALTGYTGIQRWFVFIGTGGNGKSTLLNHMLHMLGSYASGTNAEAFQVQHGGKDYGLSRFKTKRLVVATETPSQAIWNTGLLAALTGGDVIEAEEKYRQPETFVSRSKIIVASTHFPRLRNIDHALERRFTAAPFKAKFPAYDAMVPHELAAEAPAFLGYLIQEAAALYRGHAAGLTADKLLPLPPAVLEASRVELEAQDVLGQWIAQHTVPDAEALTSVKLLYEHFTRTALERHNRDWRIDTFSAELAKRGFDRTRKLGNRVTMFKGLRLVAEATGFDAAPLPPQSNVISLHTRQALAMGETLGPDIEEEPS